MAGGWQIPTRRLAGEEACAGLAKFAQPAHCPQSVKASAVSPSSADQSSPSCQWRDGSEGDAEGSCCRGGQMQEEEEELEHRANLYLLEGAPRLLLSPAAQARRGGVSWGNLLLTIFYAFHLTERVDEPTAAACEFGLRSGSASPGTAAACGRQGGICYCCCQTSYVNVDRQSHTLASSTRTRSDRALGRHCMQLTSRHSFFAPTKRHAGGTQRTPQRPGPMPPRGPLSSRPTR